MKKVFAYLFILILVTTTVTQVYHTYCSENIEALSGICQVEEESNAEFKDVQRMPVTFNCDKNIFADLFKKQIALPVYFPCDQHAASRIDFPPELA